MKMRMMTGAYLINGNQILMMKRSKDRNLAPNVWTGIGGHIEDSEHNTPQESCFREILEETGITSSEIENLKLRYILFRKSRDEIRQHFIYFGHSSKVDVVNTDEGDLHWIDLSDIVNLEMPLTVKFMLKHFIESPNEQQVFVGTVNKSQIEWSQLMD
jgi:8-oxo-dGTP diphosphatase